MSQSMDRRQLPQQVGKPSIRSRAIASASKTLVTRFPTLANAVEKEFSDPTARVRDFEETRTNRKMFDTKNSNVTQVDQIILNVDEQNNILRQIIDELKRSRGGPGSGSTDLPRVRGTRGGTRRTPPGRGRYGAAGRARLERRQQFRAQQGTAPAPRPPVPVPDVSRPPAPETPRSAPAANRLEERQVGSRRVQYDSASYRTTVAGVRFGGSLLLALNALEIAGEVRDLVALRNLNQTDSEQGITEEEFTDEIARLTGSVLAGAAGSIVGAKLGAVLGTAAGGPWGALVGGLLGGVAGGMQGAQAGDLVAALILDEITGSNRFATMLQEAQDRAQAQRTTPASELGAEPETPDEAQVFEMMQREEQRQRDAAGIQERYTDPVLEEIIVRLGRARETARNNPRRQNAVTNIQNELRNYLRSRGSRLNPADAARAQQALEDILSSAPATGLARPVSQRQESNDFVDALTSHEFDEIKIEANEIEFDGEVSFETESTTPPGGYLTPIASFATERTRQVPFVSRRAGTTSSIDVMEPSEAQQMPIPTTAPEPSYQAPAAPQAQQPSQVAAPRISTRSAAPPRISARPSEVTPQTPVTTAPPAASTEPPAATQQPQAQSATPTEGGGDFMSQLRAMSSRLGVSAENMVAIMRSESSLNPQAVNPTTGASGLIQFMPRTARSLGTTVEDIRRMSAIEQLPFVERFFRSVGVQPGSSAGRLYAYVFLPGRANREVLTERGESFYEANRGLDMDRDGRITIADLDARLARFGGTLASESGGMVSADQAANRTARGGGGQQAMGQSAAATSPARIQPQRITRDVPLNRRLEGQAT